MLLPTLQFSEIVCSLSSLCQKDLFRTRSVAAQQSAIGIQLQKSMEIQPARYVMLSPCCHILSKPRSLQREHGPLPTCRSEMAVAECARKIHAPQVPKYVTVVNVMTSVLLVKSQKNAPAQESQQQQTSIENKVSRLRNTLKPRRVAWCCH